MKNNITELVFILDRSGSMSGLEKDTIGGFNSMLERQKELDGRCYVTTVLFDSASETVHDRAELYGIKPMTEKDYTVGGCTALLDAVGDTIEHIGKIHKYIRKEDVPEKTIVVITTDGEENSSRKYSRKQIKQMISERERKGWSFVFMGANIDVKETAEDLGIDAKNAMPFVTDCGGIKCMYEEMAEVTLKLRENKEQD